MWAGAEAAHVNEEELITELQSLRVEIGNDTTHIDEKKMNSEDQTALGKQEVRPMFDNKNGPAIPLGRGAPSDLLKAVHCT